LTDGGLFFLVAHTPIMSFSSADIQQQRSKGNPIKHEIFIISFGTEEVASIGCGDIKVLHNISIHMKNLVFENDKFHKTIDRFHVIVRTMRRSPHWDWVKPDHILTILVVMDKLFETFDLFVPSFQKGLQIMLEEMEQSVENGSMTEGDYLLMANGLKQPHDFICGSEFKGWLKNRSVFFKTLQEMPTVKLTQHPHYNENDGKMLLITK